MIIIDLHILKTYWDVYNWENFRILIKDIIFANFKCGRINSIVFEVVN